MINQRTQRRARPPLAWGLLATAMLTMFVSFFLEVRGASGSTQALEDIIWSLSFVGFPVVGAIIASRRPSNRIGWILCAIGVFLGLGLITNEYAAYALDRGSAALPGVAVSAWVSSWVLLPALGLVPLLVLLFPADRIGSRTWRALVGTATLSLIAVMVCYALRPGPLDGFPSLPNPVGIQALDGPTNALIPLLGSALVASGFATVAEALLRFRRASGDQRQQLKWFASAAAVFPILMALSSGLEAAGMDDDLVTVVAFFVSLNGMAAAIGLALFKYRLYDIDLIINRALVYALLTVLLGLVYVTGVVGIGGVVRSVTASRENSLVVAVSTLAVAALFGPVRARVQGFIDRRFYRRKYDAAMTLEAFSAYLRNQVDLEEISRALVSVVEATMQPERTTLWLREAPARRPA